jgi:predicted transcriptional regulator YdeE
MHPTLVEHGPLSVVGISVRTTNRDEASPATAKIPGLWQSYFSEAIANTIPARLDDGTILGVYTDYASDHTGPYTLVVGQAVNDTSELPEELVCVTVPHGRYLLFTSASGTPDAIRATWQEIWRHFEQPGEHRRAFTSDMEVHRAGTLEVYISVV